MGRDESSVAVRDFSLNLICPKRREHGLTPKRLTHQTKPIDRIGSGGAKMHGLLRQYHDGAIRGSLVGSWKVKCQEPRHNRRGKRGSADERVTRR